MPPTSGSVLLQLFAAAFRSSDDDSDSDDDADTSQQLAGPNIDRGIAQQQHQQHNDRDETIHDASFISETRPKDDLITGTTPQGVQSGLSFGSVKDKKTVTNKLQSVFGYSKDEELIGEYSCWLARSLLLPGYLYITTHHICFYANLPSNHDVVQKEGFFSIKSTTTTNFNRYWFILKNDVLSYYSDQSEVYYPIKTIDLKGALSAEPSLRNELAFYIHTPTRRIKFKTDSGLARADWVKAIQKSIFHAKMNEHNVKISIPLSYVTDIDINPTSFVDTIQLTVKDTDGAEDEFFFTYFDDTQGTLTLLRKQMEESKQAETEKRFKLFNSTSPGADSTRKSLQDESPQGPLASSISGSNQVPSQSSMLGTVSKLNPLRYFQAVDADEGDDSANKGLPFSSFFGTSSTTTDQSLEQNSDDKGDIDLDNQEQETFRKEFSLPEGEAIGEVVPGYLLRYLPLYGKVYLSDNYICFRSTVYGTSTKVIVPLSDVVHVNKHHGTRFYFHGLGMYTTRDEEVFLEFSSRDTRNSILAGLRDRITQDAQERRKQHRAQAVIDSPSVQLDDPMESRVLDSLHYQDQPMSLAAHPGFKPSRPLHITCLTIGSRGDVQPYIAFCKRLMQDGHSCRIATHGEYKDWVESHGIEFGHIGGDPGELIELCVENGMFTVSFMREALKRFRGWLGDLMETAWTACQGTDVLIESPSAMVGIHIAEALEIPYFRAFPFPWTRTRSFPHPFAVAERNLGRGYNYMTFAMMDQVLWKGISRQINKWRKNGLGLTPTTAEKMEAHRVPCLYSWSPHLLPAPMDWHSWVHVTGYWFLDNPNLNWSPPGGLKEFLEADPVNKPIYIGFGSMVVSDPEEMTKIIVDSVIQAGVRAIISKGWSDKLSSSEKDGPVAVVKKEEGNSKDKEKVYPSNVYMLKSVPHDWLFPRLAGAVHHGGAGTTAAGLRAGIPIVIKPYFGDQYFWAQRVEEAGVGVWCHDLTVKKLSAALTAITTDEKMIKKAQLMGERIRAEDGVGTAIHHFYHDLPITRERLKSLREARNDVAVSFRNNGEEDDRAIVRPPTDTGSTGAGRSKAFIQHAATVQTDSHPSVGGATSPKQIPLQDHLKVSATEPGPDRSFDDSDKSAEGLAAGLEAIQPRRPDQAIRLAHDHLATKRLEKLDDKTDKTYETSDITDEKDEEDEEDEENEKDKSDSSEDLELSSDGEEKKVITINNKKPSKVRRALGTIKSKMSRVKGHLNPSKMGDRPKGDCLSLSTSFSDISGSSNQKSH
ncbi:Sterol 3-beta-glucosyltransferase [Mortierella hygrophila]|uniref:sterol 3beta-glucosyltransferase n=1 Tax=Mortierella hygrophila TaxID=979708 RepID=A0A9P6K1P5_9FUNG|nr:Sterol 3-beta-glucosyltransferase [Mortierella hygrophila]